MRTIKFLVIMAMLHWTVGQIDLSAPGCAVRCWENTKYVSKCPTEDYGCLCSEAEYQNSVFQCLYSQCNTAHFGSALHHTLSQCSSIDVETFLAIPPIPNHDSLRRREADYLAGDKLYGSGSAVGYPTQSIDDLPTQSPNNYPTQSVGGPYSLSVTPSSSLPPYFPLNTATLPATTSATATEPSYSAVPASAPSGPQLYTGMALHLVPSTALPVLVVIVSFCLSL